LKIDAHLKTAPKPENKNYNHFTPISGQGSAQQQLKAQTKPRTQPPVQPQQPKTFYLEPNRNSMQKN
jgi:hypothetical protein